MAMMDRRVGARKVCYGKYGEVISPRCGMAYEVKAIAKGRERQQA
jgi:hypothetical protein